MAEAPSDGPVSRPSRVEEAMARVRASLPGIGNDQAGPSQPASLYPRETALFPEDLYRSLHQARTLAGGLSIHYTMGFRTPFVGQIWMAIRKRIHAEIRIYIDALTHQQSLLNTHVVRALTQSVETLESFGLPALQRRQQDQARLIEELRAEVRALRERCERLEAGYPTGEALPTEHVARN
ncbi:MAG TPA: hypothetical protein VFZ25_19605 [Chloroflexota bacterium]|nr:hypothetical protein [Chloroflexota bacterium]